MTKIQDSITPKLIFTPPFSSKVDPSSISSLSLSKFESVLITHDNKIKSMFDNSSLHDESHPSYKREDFTEYEMKDESGVRWFPISSYVAGSFAIYLLSEIEKGMQARIAYTSVDDSNITFMNVENSYPVALFGSSYGGAAIDLQGGIIHIPQFFYIGTKSLKTYYLPNNEKAVEVAFNNNDFFVLSSNGKLFKSKEKDKNLELFTQVKQFEKKKIVQISGIYNHLLILTDEGIVYSYGNNRSGQLGIGSKKLEVNKFKEITSLKKYKIKAVYTGYSNSIFQTNDGNILGCGNIDINLFEPNHKKEEKRVLIPVEIPIKNVELCIMSVEPIAFLIGFDAKMSPNRNIKNKNEIKIILLGDKIKKQILNFFTKNNFDDSFVDEKKDEYNVTIKIDQLIINLTLIDLSCFDDDQNMRIKNLQRANNILLFYDGSNSSSSFDDIKKLYEESKEVWHDDLNLAIVVLHSEKSIIMDKKETKTKDMRLLLRSQALGGKLKCKVFHILNSNDMTSINEPFYYFLNIEENSKEKKEIIKLGREHENPFLKIKKDHINIGLFGNSNVNKTEISFKYIFDDLYMRFYEDFVQNFVEIDLTKVVEVSNQIVTLSIIDSSFVNNIDDSYYSVVQGIILFFNIDIIATREYIKEIEQFYIKIIGSPCVIALVGNEINQDLINDKIKSIERVFDCMVFLISAKTDENIEEMFYCLTKKIIQNTEQNKKHSKKKKKKEKRKI